MSTNSNVANLSITVVKTLVKMAGFGRLADMIDGGQECLNLLADIKNDALGNPNAEMIRSLNGAVKSELDAIQGALQRADLSRKQIKDAVAQLSDAACQTIKDLAEDDDALIRAVEQPQCFAEQLRGHAAPLPDYSSDEMHTHYETLLDRLAEEFLTLAPWSTNFNRVALTSLLRCFPALSERIDRLEQHMDRRFDHIELRMRVDRDIHIENNQLLKGLSRQNASPIFDHVVFGSRPDVVAENRFVERSEQEHLNALMADPRKRCTVLVGMRGCGKTQLASALAQQCEDKNWSLVAWVNAGSPESITSDLVELARELKIDTSDQPAPKTIIRRLFNRLKSADPSDRLIVFDNVENIDDLRGLLPSGKGLRIVATTTNNAGWEHHDWKTIKVGVFDRSESIDYLLTVTRCDDHDAADALAQRLGDLPLALAQAAASARNKDLSLTRYLDRLDSYRSERVIRPVPGDYYADDVATALCMAIEDALENLEDGTKQAALRQLGALALLAESGVPTRWLDPTIEQQDDRELQGAHQAEDEDAHDALTELIHRSIVQRSSDKATTTLHRLQAEVLRENWDDKETAEAYESATILLDTVNVDSFLRNNTDSIHLIEQFAAISTQHHSQQLFGDNKVRSCLLQALLFANTLDLPVEPQGLTNIVVILENILGSDHVDVVTARNCLAGAYRSAGYFPESINLYERVLTDRIRILGESDRSTLATRSDLASAHALAGHLPEAISQYEQVLNEQIRILGTEDVNTLTTQYNLASAYFISQQYTLAIPNYKQVLSKQTSSLGPNHPHTLVTQSSLAFAHFSAGNLSEAVSLYEEVLPNQIEQLGPSHRYTLTTRENIATAHRLEGNLNIAIDQYETVLKDCTDALGTKDPLTVDVHKKLKAARRELARQKGDSRTEERGSQD